MAALYTIGAFAVIFDAEGRVLLCHRRDMDMWNLPGGGVESGELPTEAVIREVKEETGLDVVVQRLVGVYGKSDKDDLVFAFVCEGVGGALTETDESDACRYFALDDMPSNTMPRQVTRIRDAIASETLPLFRRQTEPSSKVWLQRLERYTQSCQKLFELRSRIVDVHPLLQKLYPIAIVADAQFYIFDVDDAGQAYTFVKQAPTPMPIPQGVRAAFPLNVYDGRAVCVVTDEVFDEPGGYVTILHEFVHCYQWEACEPQLRETLEIARAAIVRGDFMWELNYAFPYEAPTFMEPYAAFLDAVARNQGDRIQDCRVRLSQTLRKDEFEYMVWQEWKEGFARTVENRIKQRLGLTENHGGAEPPFSRVTFYEGGARWLAFWASQEPAALLDIEKLFHRMKSLSTNEADS